MPENHRISLLNILILLFIGISVCNGYQLYRDSSNTIRPIKYHVLNDPDRFADRAKQYHNTVAQLRVWRRYLDDFSNDDDGLEGFLHQYKSSEYSKR